MKNKRGNVAVIAIIVVIVAITTSVITWLVATKTQAPVQQAIVTQPAPIVKTQPASQPTVQTQPEVSPTIYHITDLGVQFSLPNSLSDLTYEIVHLEGDQAVNSVGFSSKKLADAGCNLEAPLGYLTYDNDKKGVLIGHARGSDLFYISPKEQCKVAATSQDWQVLQKALKSIVIDENVN